MTHYLKTILFMATFLSLNTLQASHFLVISMDEDSIGHNENTSSETTSISDSKIETIVLDANSNDCYNCQILTYSFPGKDISYIRLYDSRMKCKEINAAISPGEMTYAFKREGSYYMEFNYKDGHRELKKIIVKLE